jgi:chitin deacetylase
VVPYTLSENDMKFVAPNGFTTGDQFFEYLRDHLDYLVREARLGEGGRAGGAVGKMMSVGLHCRVVGRPGRMAGLEKFLGEAACCPALHCTVLHCHCTACVCLLLRSL